MFWRVFVLLGLVAAAALASPSPQQEEHRVQFGDARAKAEILWDEWGVPHIYAQDFESLSYAFGYAQARDQGRLLAQMLFFSSGKAAETRRFYSAIDQLMYSLRIKQNAEKYFDLQHPETVSALENFAAGVNAFVEEHPDLFDGDFGSVFPINGLDVFSANLRVLYTFTFANIAGFADGFEQKYGPDPLKEMRKQDTSRIYSAYESQDPMHGMGVPPELRHMIGSNAWAINSRSGRTDGKPKLNQNPHLPYFIFFRWYEAQLTCEACDIDVYGASLIGIPNLQIAFNDYLGWTHTVNPIQAFTVYELDLIGDDSYYYDGKLLRLTTEEVTYRVKQVIGYKQVKVVNEFTVHGQVMARANGKILVKRLAGFDDQLRPDAIKQWWDMGRAKNLAQFKQAMEQLQVPMFYTFVTTRDDDIFYNFNGWVPKRKSGDWASWGRPVNGSTSETFWEEVHPWAELPSLENPLSGFVQNANEPPWTATLPVFTLNPDRYPAYMAPPASVSYRSQASLRLISSGRNLTFEDFAALKHSTIKEATFHTLDDLLAAVERFGEDPLVLEAAEVLRSWDRLTETTSRGADLFQTWIRESPSKYEMLLNPWDPADPLNTPNTLADPRGAVEDLLAAASKLRDKGVALDSEYGENNRLFASEFLGGGTLPGNGCPDCFRNAYYILGLALGGDSYVCIVEWDGDKRPRASSLMGFGNASPGAKGAPAHVNDQNALFSKKELKPVWREREEVLQHLEEQVLLL